MCRPPTVAVLAEILSVRRCNVVTTGTSPSATLAVFGDSGNSSDQTQALEMVIPSIDPVWYQIPRYPALPSGHTS